MLIHIDPALLAHPTEWNSLKTFLRSPFSEESCLRVDKQLPQLAEAYRAMAETRADWAGALPLSQIDDAAGVFMPATAIGSRALPPVPQEMLKVQIVLLEEVLCDDAAWLRKRSASDIASTSGPVPKLDADTSRLALRAIALHEAAFLVLAGLFEIRRIGSIVEFFFTSRGLECLRNRVLTTPMQEQTEFTLRQELLSLIATLRRRDRKGTASIAALVVPALLDDLEDRFLDMFFSLGAHMRRDPEVALLIRGARGLCRWFALLELVRLADETSLLPNSDLLERLCLDTGLLEQVLAERTSAVPSWHPTQRFWRAQSRNHGTRTCHPLLQGGRVNRKAGWQARTEV
jgi:hypothetical protein